MLIKFQNDQPAAHSLLYRYAAPTRWILQPLGELAARCAADYQVAVTEHGDTSDDPKPARVMYLERWLQLALQAGEQFLAERVS